MTPHEVLLASSIVLLTGWMVCEWVRSALLKRFALDHSVNEPSLMSVWNDRALTRVEKSLPPGSIRTRVKLFHAASRLSFFGFLATVFIVVHHASR